MGRAASFAAAIGFAVLPSFGWAQNQPPSTHVPPMLRAPSQMIPPLACPRGDTRPACLARRLSPQPTDPGTAYALRQHEDDVANRRFVPPKIIAFLHDPRIDPETRAFLLSMASKPTEDWTLAQAQMLLQLVPTLTEMYIPTRVLSDFYEFLGLDPTQLFDPQLGRSWQRRSTGLDKNDFAAVEQAQCFSVLGYGEVPDPTQVTLGALAACSTAGK